MEKEKNQERGEEVGFFPLEDYEKGSWGKRKPGTRSRHEAGGGKGRGKARSIGRVYENRLRKSGAKEDLAYPKGSKKGEGPREEMRKQSTHLLTSVDLEKKGLKKGRENRGADSFSKLGRPAQFWGKDLM